MLIMISAEHIYVLPKVINPVRKLVTSLKLIVLVTVCLRVYLEIRSIPRASNMIAMYINYFKVSFLFT